MNIVQQILRMFLIHLVLIILLPSLTTQRLQMAINLHPVPLILGSNMFFLCINIRQVPREVLKTEAGVCSF